MQRSKYPVAIADKDLLSVIEMVADVASKFYTIPAYSTSRRPLGAKQSISVEVKEPSNTAIEILTKFAQETGDFADLTENDIELMALLYDMESEICGVEHINCTSLLDRSWYFDRSNELREVGVNICSEPCVYFSLPGGCTRGNSCIYRHPGDINRRSLSEYNTLKTNHTSPLHTKPLSANAPEFTLKTNPSLPAISSSHIHVGENSLLESVSVEEMNADTWIDASHLSSFDANVTAMEKTETTKKHAVILTKSFALQNVLIQMGFHVLSEEGTPVSQIRVWKKKCRKCSMLCKEDKNEICPYCGMRTLTRVSVCINRNGLVKVGDFLPKHIQVEKRKKAKTA